MAIFKHIKTGDLYRYEGENKFTNLRTGVSGEIRPELATSALRVCPSSSIILPEYPMVAEMIKRLNLKSEI